MHASTCQEVKTSRAIKRAEDGRPNENESALSSVSVSCSEYKFSFHIFISVSPLPSSTAFSAGTDTLLRIKEARTVVQRFTVMAAATAVVGIADRLVYSGGFSGSSCRIESTKSRNLTVRFSSNTAKHQSSNSKSSSSSSASSSLPSKSQADGPPPIPLHLELKHPESKEDALQLNMVELSLGGQGLLFGSRIPKHFFNIQGFGQTDRGDGSDPWETGSYDLALEEAGIQDLNIMKYTSVIPPEASKITKLEAQAFFRHGAVMEAIMSTMHGVKGDRITAGVGRVQIRRKKDGYHIGGYAAEYEGHATADKARDILRSDLQGIFSRRFQPEEYECFDEEFTIRSGEVEKAFGTVIAAICFSTYVFPVYVQQQQN
ncbi:arginine decarboxylase [Marchantia polymorpha subsp. ruderalis]